MSTAVDLFETYNTILTSAYRLADNKENYCKEGIKRVAYKDIVWDEITLIDTQGRSFERDFDSVDRRYLEISNNQPMKRLVYRKIYGPYSCI